MAGPLNSLDSRVFKLRLGTTKDVDKLLKAAEEFYLTTNISKTIPFCPHSVTKVIYATIAEGFIIIAESGDKIVGIIGCQPTIYPFNTEWVGCSENMFWIGEEARGTMLPTRMMKQAEQCAKAIGCDFLCMARMPTSPKSTDGWYKKMGFVETDVVYMKEV